MLLLCLKLIGPHQFSRHSVAIAGQAVEGHPSCNRMTGMCDTVKCTVRSLLSVVLGVGAGVDVLPG